MPPKKTKLLRDLFLQFRVSFRCISMMESAWISAKKNQLDTCLDLGNALGSL